MRGAWALCLSCAIGLAAAPARAQGLERCEELYVDAAFDDARRCVDEGLTDLAERPAALRDAYALLAATELAADREPAARRAALAALTIDPTFAPDNPLLRAPRVLSLFEDLRATTPVTPEPARSAPPTSPPARPPTLAPAAPTRLHVSLPPPPPSRADRGGIDTGVAVGLTTLGVVTVVVVTVLLATDRMEPVFRIAL